MFEQKLPEQKTITGYVTPEDISIADRIGRVTLGNAIKVVASVTGAYAGYQAAAIEPEMPTQFIAILEKIGGGVAGTVSDFSIAIKFLIENPEAYQDLFGENDTISRQSVDTASRVYEDFENTATSAAGNLVRDPITTLISAFGVAGLIKYFGSFCADMLTLRDRPNLSQRLRQKAINKMRKPKRSRRIEISDSGTSLFLRR